MTAMRLASIHEAAHAVVAQALGFNVEHVSIAQDGSGLTSYVIGDEDTVAGIEDRIVVTIAGPIASNIIAGTDIYARWHAADHDKIAALTAMLARRASFPDLRVLACEQRAAELVRANRREIEAMADKLIEGQTQDAQG